MIKFKLVIFTLILATSFNCKAQQLEETQYSNNIIGTWVLEEDTNNKLVFTNDNKCKVYVDNQLDITYEYSFNNVCLDYEANDIVYLKWREIGTLGFTCIEVSSMTLDSISLMLIDSAQILYYNRE